MEKHYLVEEDFIYKGFRCVIIGNPLGHRCGYVGLPRGHKYYGDHYDDIPVICHGGLTYGRHNPNYPVANNEGLYWIGFDCNHAGDSPDRPLYELLNRGTPSMPNRYSALFTGGRVWTKSAVNLELHDIVNQLISE